MPFITKAQADARRAARAANAASTDQPTAPTLATADIDRTEDAPAESSLSLPPAERSATKRRGHARKSEDGKWLPTGDYPEGWCRPPLQGQFQLGGKPGPGRPKGAVSTDKLYKKHLDRKREVTIEGRRIKITHRELILLKTMADAIDGKNRAARAHVLAKIEKLYPENVSDSETQSAQSISESDALSIAEFEAELRAQLAEENTQLVGNKDIEEDGQ